MSYIPIELRRSILDKSSGCCEYYRVHQRDNTVIYHIEHIIAIVHGGLTAESNLAYSCSRCNLYKGTNIAAADPLTGEPTFLFHPRRDNWDEHFQLDSEGYIVGMTPEGRATALVLRLNEESRILFRQVLIALEVYPCQK